MSFKLTEDDLRKLERSVNEAENPQLPPNDPYRLWQQGGAAEPLDLDDSYADSLDPEALNAGAIQPNRQNHNAFLERNLNMRDHQRLSQWVEDLIKWGAAGANRRTFKKWLISSAPALAKGSAKPGLAAIIEAATRLSINEVEQCIEAILENEASDSEAAVIAGQRVRFVQFTSGERRRACGIALQRWIEKWERGSADSGPEIDKAVACLPSVPFLLGEACVPWMLERLAEQQPTISWAAAVGLSRWLNTLDGRYENETLFAKAAERFEAETQSAMGQHPDEAEVDLRGALTELLAHTASPGTVNQAAAMLAKAFCAPRRFEDAAAVRAGRVLVKRFGNSVFEAIETAFRSAGDVNYFEYLGAMIQR